MSIIDSRVLAEQQRLQRDLAFETNKAIEEARRARVHQAEVAHLAWLGDVLFWALTRDMPVCTTEKCALPAGHPGQHNTERTGRGTFFGKDKG